MARSLKRGIHYFSMDVDIFADRKVRRVLHDHGAQAMGVITFVLCQAYGENGYYVPADDALYFDVSDALGVDEAYARAVVRGCVESGFFDAGLFEKYGILTSHRVQANFLAATYKRKTNNAIEPDYCLADRGEPGTPVWDAPQEGGSRTSDGSCHLLDGGSRTSDIQSAQTKRNETKGKKTKAHESAGVGAVSFGSYVRMSEDEYAALKQEYGEAAARRMVEMLGDYKASNGKRYENDYYAIRSWVVKRWHEEQCRAGYSGKPGYFERPAVNYDHLALDPFAQQGG